VYLWDIATGQKLRTYTPEKRILTGVLGDAVTFWTVAISPDGNTIAAGGTDRGITLWDIESEEATVSFNAVGSGLVIPGLEGENLWSLVFTSNTVLWSNDGRHGLKRWDLTAKPTPKAQALAPNIPFREDVVQILAVSADRTPHST